jgi:hypothetical protein
VENSKIMILREVNRTRAWIAKRLPGCFEGGKPDYDWDRTLSDSECEMLLRDPYCMFERTRFNVPNK